MSVDRPRIDEGLGVDVERPERSRRSRDTQAAAHVGPLPVIPVGGGVVRRAPAGGRDVHVEGAPLVDHLGCPQVGPRPAGFGRFEGEPLELPVHEVVRPVDGDPSSARGLAGVVEVESVEVLEDERVTVVITRLADDDRVSEDPAHGIRPAPSTASTTHARG
jgi:hypothetical protein